MKRFAIVATLVTLVLGGSVAAHAKIIDLAASPNPATLGERVRHDVSLGVSARLEIWVSARGFEQPGLGTLPSGAWSAGCCPSQTAGTPAWYFRSSSIAPPGAYRFGAVSRARGTWLSSAVAGGTLASVWARVR
jgi:hypothetical protein